MRYEDSFCALFVSTMTVSYIIYRPRSREDNVFTGVCHSVRRGGVMSGIEGVWYKGKGCGIEGCVDRGGVCPGDVSQGCLTGKFLRR